MRLFRRERKCALEFYGPAGQPVQEPPFYSFQLFSWRDILSMRLAQIKAMEKVHAQ